MNPKLLYIVLAVLLHEKAIGVTNLATFPSILHVDEDKDTDAMVKCYNVTLDSTDHTNHKYDPISNAWWYRQFPNGSRYRITATKPPAAVFVQKYILTFYPKVRRIDQGQYFCCIPGGRYPSGNSCSALVNVSIAVAPDIEVVRANYTGYAGYNVTLLCKIVNMGTPHALFHWKKQGRDLPNNLVRNNATHTALTLTNVTKSDEAEYMCVVKGVLRMKQHSIYLHVEVLPKISVFGPRLALAGKSIQLTCEGNLPSFHITTPLGETIQGSLYNFTTSLSDTGHYQCVGKLDASDITVTESHYLYVYDINNTTSTLSFLVFVNGDYCKYVKTHTFEGLLLDALMESILKLCDCTVSVTIKRFQCAGEHSAYFDITVEGFMAGNVKEYLENNPLTANLDLGIATLYVCDNGPCWPTTTTGNGINNVTPQGDNGKHSESQSTPIIVIVFCLSVLAIVVICLIAAFVLNRLMCSNKEWSCTICNCIIRHKPPLPTKSDIQFLCKECTNTNLPNKDNLSVPTELDITSGNVDEPGSPSPMIFNTTFGETKEPKHDSNFRVVDISTALNIIVTDTLVVGQQVPQTLSAVHKNGSYGISNYGRNNEDTTQQTQSGSLADRLTPVNHQTTRINGVQKQTCETSV